MCVCVCVCVHFTHLSEIYVSLPAKRYCSCFAPRSCLHGALLCSRPDCNAGKSCGGGRPRCWHLYQHQKPHLEVVGLSWDTLTTYYSRFKIHWPWLEWIVRVVNLLGKIEGVVNCIWSTTSRWSCALRYSREV